MDKYDEAIDYLNHHPEEMVEAYRFPGDHVAGCLFVNASRELYLFRTIKPGKWLRDPISIKGSERYVAQDDHVTDAIRRDPELPSSIGDCGLQHLPHLAEWQRELDRIYNRRHITRTEEDEYERPQEDETEEDSAEDEEDPDTVDPDVGGGGIQDDHGDETESGESTQSE